MAAYVKVRKRGAKSWAFLTSRGGTNRLRVHAARFEDVAKAEQFIAANATDNPEWEMKATAVKPSPSRASP